VLTNLFDERSSYVVRSLPFPKGGFLDSAQMHEWVLEQSENFDALATEFRSR